MGNETMRDNQRTTDFVEGVSELASEYIRARFHRLPADERVRVRQFAMRVLKDNRLKKKPELRAGSVRLIVALLPETFAVLEDLLRNCSSPLWYEVHFTIFCALDRSDLEPLDQARVLRLIRQYLMDIQSGAGFAAWKAGDLLGDEWRDCATVEILEELLLKARYVPGRKAALHGIEHALNSATKAENKELVTLLQTVAQKDRSLKVRRDAQLTLKGAGCGPNVYP